MTDYGTIKIPKDEYDRHNERRKANGQTWAEYIDGQSPKISNNEESVDFDDVKQACRAAIRDEIPDKALR